jgi:hypothetical protein
MLWQLRAPLVYRAIVSLLGLGYLFSGATEAWLVDAPTRPDYGCSVVFSRGQARTSPCWSVRSRWLAQLTNLAPLRVRAAILIVVFILALIMMHDIGFTPQRGGRPLAEMRTILRSSIDNGLRVPPVRALMIAGFFTGGVEIYVFYALQPYLLQLWGNPHAYGIAGLVAALVAGAGIIGGLLAPVFRRLFHRRTSALLMMESVAVGMLALIGLIHNFGAVNRFILVWGLVYAAADPIRQAYLNGLIPSQQRATILSFDSLMSSAGGIVAQPALGRSADVWSYPISYVISAGWAALSLPFLVRARQMKMPADTETAPADTPPAETPAADQPST